MKEFKPVNLTAVEVAFPATVVGRLLPLWDDIPQEFKNDKLDWCGFVNRWFACGCFFVPKVKKGFDNNEVWKHLKACMCSFEPSHEHKVAGVAYLMSLWLEPLPENWRERATKGKKDD